MPSRYTVRFPATLDAAVQERIRTTGTPFAVLIREATAPWRSYRLRRAEDKVSGASGWSPRGW